MVFVEKVLLLFSLIMGQHGTYSRSPQTGAAEHNRNFRQNLFNDSTDHPVFNFIMIEPFIHRRPRARHWVK